MVRVCVSLVTICSPLWLAAIAQANSLQPGLYWGGGSRYITIARSENGRVCYQGSSRPGAAVVASLLPVRGNSRLYTIYGFTNIGLAQRDRATLLFGALTTQQSALLTPLEYRVDGSAALTTTLRRCLNSPHPFHERITSSR